MKIDQIYKEISEFSESTHGSTDYDKDELFVLGKNDKEFAPLRFLKKKIEGLKDYENLLSMGFIYNSYDLFSHEHFQGWYEHQFGKKLTRTVAKKISILQMPNNKEIFEAIEGVFQNYEVLRDQQILLNGKNLPVQLGEWYAKCIFGLQQKKSTSQRGFDFYLDDKRTEVKVHWSDTSSPKGVKLRKSLVDLSEYCIVIYLARNFMIREICFLDSEFILRKFATKGHTIFLKDVDIAPYFFSKSAKHQDKVVNSSALLKFSSPTFAVKIAEKFQ